MIDVIIISYAKDGMLKAVTEYAIKTLKETDVDGLCNIIVVESNKDVSYNGVTMVYPDAPFNYNAYCNMGARAGNNEWVCVCNNDLEFTNGWYVEMLKCGFDSMSPKCSLTPTNAPFQGVVKGYKTAQQLNGWCIFLKRSVWEKIGGFDEDFEFWCADDSYREQLLVNNIDHYLICNAIVNHLNGGSNTLKTVKDRDIMNDLTMNQALKYNKKYNRNLFNLGQ